MSNTVYERDMVSQGELKVCNIRTHDNPVVKLTKLVPIVKFKLRSILVGIIV
jgi:hypothetical protein